jgi:glycosyltransferase involved in cell wall biosynthesis
MNILIICHEFSPVGGGSGTAAMHVGQELAKHHTVTVLTSGFRGFPKRETKDRLEIIRTSGRRGKIYGMTPFELLIFTIFAIPAAIRLHRRRRYDCCLAFHAIPAAWVSVALWKLYRVPYVISLQGADVPGFLPSQYDHLHKIVIGLTRLIWKNAKGVAVVSQGLRELAERTAQTIGVPLDLIPNGVDLNFYQPAERNIGPNPVKALFVGRLTEQKGLMYLLQALKERFTEVKDRLRIEIVGDGYLKNDLRNYVGNEELSRIVSFSPWLDGQDLLNKYQSSSFLILPSVDEGMSIVLLAAMACGLPAVATTVGGNDELVEDGVNGFLVPPRDPMRLGDALVRMAGMDQGRLKAMGKVSRERAEMYGWPNVTLAYLKHLDAKRR